jgi:hypothetical protein
MNYNKLSPEEERVIVHKETEFPSLVNMTIFLRMECLSVEGVMHIFFHLKVSLMPAVNGQALMKVSQMQ